jgi:hypothetical protein
LVLVQVDVPEKNLNDILTIGANFSISEKLYGPMDASYEINRCTFDMKNCEKFININARQICQKFYNTSTMIGQAVANISPPIKCPIEAGNYTMRRIHSDLKRFSFLPIDGFNLNMIIKFVTTVPATKARVVASCIKLEMKVEKIRSKT